MTIHSLHLAKDLSLPLDVVTQTIAILAKRRAGKSWQSEVEESEVGEPASHSTEDLAVSHVLKRSDA